MWLNLLCTSDDGVAKVTAGPEHARQLQEQKAGAQQLMDEYFKLDFESTAGGLPCRCGAFLCHTRFFRYMLQALPLTCS